MPPAIQSRMQASALGLGCSIAAPDSSATTRRGAPDIPAATPAAAMARRNSRRVRRSGSEADRSAGNKWRGAIMIGSSTVKGIPTGWKSPDQLELGQHEDDPEQVLDPLLRRRVAEEFERRVTL